MDEQRIVHNPQNLLQVDEKGLLKILISKDDSVGEIENAFMESKRTVKEPKIPVRESPIFVSPVAKFKNQTSWSIKKDSELNPEPSQTSSAKVRDQQLMDKIKLLYQDAKNQQTKNQQAN